MSARCADEMNSYRTSSTTRARAVTSEVGVGKLREPVKRSIRNCEVKAGDDESRENKRAAMNKGDEG
jgi:hypothetical protein